MQAGQLRHRVTIQQKTAGVDEWGAPLPDAWVDFATVWANVRHLSGTETIKAGADTSVVKASIRIRARNDITAGMRVVHGTSVYDIEAVLPGARDHVDLACQKVG